MEVNKLYHADCLDPIEGMAKLPEKVASMILCDLPYGTTQNKWDVIIPFERLWEQYTRIAKEDAAIVLTASQPFTSMLIMSNLPMFKYSLVWDKKICTGFLNSKRQPLRQHEDVLVFYRKQPTYNPQMHSNKLNRNFDGNTIRPSTENYGQQRDYISTVKGNVSYPRSIIVQTGVVNNSKAKLPHPTQKPVSLFEYLINTYTNPGDIVIDNCVGSGTTIEACINTNRHYICWEKEEKHYLTARKREHSKLSQTLKLGL